MPPKAQEVRGRQDRLYPEVRKNRRDETPVGIPAFDKPLMFENSAKQAIRILNRGPKVIKKNAPDTHVWVQQQPQIGKNSLFSDLVKDAQVKVRGEAEARKSSGDDSTLNSIAVLNINKGNLMELRGKVQGDRLKILLDDGAGMSLINRKKVEQLNLSVFPAAHEIGLKGFQGEVSEVCTETTDVVIEVVDQSGYTHKLGVVRALVCDLRCFDMILGMPSHIEFDIRKNYMLQE